ncbi:MAG: DUF4214 domain-containing protein [Clostridia bacterium]|nr:DUF4214 domain-containing protein [Clostridia bacterium]
MGQLKKRIITLALTTTMCFTALPDVVWADGVFVKNDVKICREDMPDAEKGVRDFVARLYEVALGRAAEAAGLERWTEDILNGMPAVEVAQNFFESEEFLNLDMTDEEYVDTLYNTFFGRIADYDGKVHWINLLEEGATRRFVLAGFANSDEFQNLCDSYGVTRGTLELNETSDLSPDVNAFVRLAYMGILEREPDEAGLEYWVGRIVNDGLTASEMIEGFFGSDEIMNKNLSDEEFVTVCYRTFLLREPEKEGLEAWVDKLNTDGLSRKYVMYGMSASQEFTNLCEEYGVTKGEIKVSEPRDLFPAYTAFVNKAYIVFYGSKADAAVLNDYMKRLGNGSKTLRRIIEDIANSASDSDREEWISSLYVAALGRNCSDAEMQSQMNTYENSGKSVVIESIVESDEFDSRCEELGLYSDCRNHTERGENGALYGYSFDGKILTGWNYVDGYKFFFYNDGTMSQDVRDIIGDQDRYYLTVNTANNIIMVYAWDDATDDWNIPVVAFVASCGKPGTETILGDYILHSQSRWGLMMGGVYCQYLTRISGDYLIHSECYSTTNVYTMDTWGYSLLGQAASHGCVRTTCANAKWVYEHCNECPIHLYKDASVSAPFDKPVPPPCTGTFDPTDPLCK